jgi:hypothetical protein
MLLGKLLCAGKFACFQTKGFAKLDRLLKVEDRFAPAIANMDMNRPMVVAVKKETMIRPAQKLSAPIDCRQRRDSSEISLLASRDSGPGVRCQLAA